MTDAGRAPGGQEPVIRDLVEYLIVVVPDVASLPGLASAFDRLVGAAAIRLLDLVVVVKEPTGTVEVLEAEDIEGFTQLPKTKRALGGLLSEGDLELVAVALQPGTVGVVVVTEDRWALDLSRAAHEAGGEIVAGEHIPPTRVAAVLGDPVDNEPAPTSEPRIIPPGDA